MGDVGAELGADAAVSATLGATPGAGRGARPCSEVSGGGGSASDAGADTATLMSGAGADVADDAEAAPSERHDGAPRLCLTYKYSWSKLW